MDVRDLRYFAEVVDRGSITRAAAGLGLSQPALTKAIRALEQRLGVKLLERGPKGVVPTLYGRALHVRARSITAELHRAEAEIDELSRTSAGMLSIGVLPSQAMTVLPEAAVRLMTARPDLSLRVVERPLADLEAALRRGEFDFVISLEAHDNADGALVHKALFYDRPTVVVRPGHPAAGRARVPIAALAAFPWIVPPRGTERGGQIEAVFRSAGLAMPRGLIECHSASFLKKIVMESDYVGLLQNDLPTLEEQAGLLCAIDMDPELPGRAVGVLHRAHYPLTEAAQALIREIQRACLRLGYRKATRPQDRRAAPRRSAAAASPRRGAAAPG